MPLIPALAGMLSAVAWPIISRVLLALGIGTLTYVGLDAVLNQLLDKAMQSANSITGPLAQLLALIGFFDALAIVSGAMVSALSLVVLKKLTMVKGL